MLLLIVGASFANGWYFDGLARYVSNATDTKYFKNLEDFKEELRLDYGVDILPQ